MGVFNFKSCLQAVDLATNLIPLGLETAEEITDMIVGLELFVGKFGIRPDLRFESIREYKK